MPNLESVYMGIPVKNPLVLGACSLTGHMDSIRRVAEKGVGAIVIKSLFEEQIQLEKYKLEEDVRAYDEWHAEMQDIFPDVEHAGPEEHLMWVRKAVEELDIPVIASLNCLTPETWEEWAKRLAETGCHGLELNFFALPADRDVNAAAIEEEQIDTVARVKKAVKIPVSVKLSAFYTSPVNIITRMSEAGAEGFVLFNRMFHPSLDIDSETTNYPFNQSSPSDHRLSLRFVGLLAGKTPASLCASHGIHSAEDAISLLLAGADVFQVVSAVYKSSPDVIGEMLSGIRNWMQKRGYETMEEFRGKLSVERNPDRHAYRRSQYVQMLLRSDDYIKRPKLI